MFEKQQRERAHLQHFVDRFRAQASKARQAQSRIKALERMVDIAPIRAASPIRFEFREPAALPVPLLRLDEVAAGYGERRVLDDIKLSLSPGDRIALLGANGAGKSTLIKLLAGAAAAAGRRAHRGEGSGDRLLRPAPARATRSRRPRRSIISSVSTRSLGEQAARDFLGGFGFDGDRALSAVAPFSGGEKARLCLALTVYQRPNLLLLDEPTNHLDLDMREALDRSAERFHRRAGAGVARSRPDPHLLRHPAAWSAADASTTTPATSTTTRAPCSAQRGERSRRGAGTGGGVTTVAMDVANAPSNVRAPRRCARRCSASSNAWRARPNGKRSDRSGTGRSRRFTTAITPSASAN